AKGSVVRLPCSTAPVVVGSSAWTLGECSEGPPMAGIGESAVSHMTRGDRAIPARRPGDGRGAGERSQARGRRKPLAIITKLGKDAAPERGPQARHGKEETVLGMRSEGAVQLRLQARDADLHRDDDLNESGSSQPHCALHAPGLAEGGSLERGNQRV